MRRKRNNRILAAMRLAKERKRLAGPQPEYPAELPTDRPLRRIVVEDIHRGTHVIECWAGPRIDQFRATVDGQAWRPAIGWHRICRGLAKAYAPYGRMEP